jgi:hypothetical protein
MQGYAILLVYSLPFGLAVCSWRLYRVRQPAYRTLLLPSCRAQWSSPVGLGITRALAMVIPAALITALALSFLLEKFAIVGRRSLAQPGCGRPTVGFISGCCTTPWKMAPCGRTITP